MYREKDSIVSLSAFFVRLCVCSDPPDRIKTEEDRRRRGGGGDRERGKEDMHTKKGNQKGARTYDRI